jgi:hypothetical protein
MLMSKTNEMYDDEYIAVIHSVFPKLYTCALLYIK